MLQIVTVYLLQIDISLHYLLQRVTRKWGIVVQEVGKGLIVSQKVLQLET